MDEKYVKVAQELAEVQADKEKFYLEKIKIESSLDGKDNNIVEIRQQLKQCQEDSADKSLVIEHLQQAMLNHEEESAQLANKLSMLKQQMMDNETGYGMEKKFGCVKVMTLRSVPCTVSFSF